MSSLSRAAGLILLLLLVLGGAPARGQELPFEHYTTNDPVNPLPKAAVTAVYQDRSGYLWIANYGAGLVRYDGFRFDHHTTEQGLPSDQVWGLLEDRDGRLWALTEKGLAVSEQELAALEPGERVRFTSMLGTLPLFSDALGREKMSVDAVGRIWVLAGGDLILRYDPSGPSVDTLRVPPGPGGAPQGAGTLVGRRDGSVWVGGAEGRLLVYRGDARVPEVVPAPCTPINALHEGPSGVLWGGCRGGRVWREGAADDPGEPETVVVEGAGTVTALLEDRQRNVWVATLGGGLMMMPGGRSAEAVVYDRTSGMLGVNVWDILQDREGNYWIAENGGLSKLRYNYAAFGHYTGNSHIGERPALPASDVTSVLPPFRVQQQGGTAGPVMLVAGTSAGLAFIGENGQSEHLGSDRGLPNDVVLDLCRDADQNLWATTRDGIVRISFAAEGAQPEGAAGTHTLTLFGAPAHLARYAVGHRNTCQVLTLPDQPPRLGPAAAVCFSGYDLLCLISGRWFRFEVAAGLSGGELWSVVSDGRGHLYVGDKAEGLYRTVRPLTTNVLAGLERRRAARTSVPAEEIVEPVFQRLAVLPDTLGDDGVTPFLWLNGALWANTNDLLVLDGDPLRVAARLNRAAGIPDGVMSLAFSPATQTLWAGTGRGLVEVDPVKRTVLRWLNKRSGLVGEVAWGLRAVAVGDDGTLYYGTSSGLSIYRPHRDRVNDVAPTPRFSAASFVENARGHNELSLDFAALSLADEKAVRYRTRLLGYDKGWSDAKRETAIRYTNLGAFLLPRTYTFEVIAANNDGVWTETPLTYLFRVHPPWWFRWWAFIIYLVLFSGLVFVADRYQRARLLNRERAKTMLREAELRAEGAELSRQAAEMQARAMQAENDRKEMELEKARELEKAYHQLRATQRQLVQQEKLASLGALTAGIAHEIKNPLNFVNNFALNSIEIADDLAGELEDYPEAHTRVEDLVADLKLNARKIAEHGKRADGIVRSMLEHSRGTKGERQATDVNALLDEYLTLAYHGMRAQQVSFDVQIEREYDPSLKPVEMVPQEVGRVFLNLLNNAFHAVATRKAEQNGTYQAVVAVRTKQLERQVEIRVYDNGPGIPEHLREKIFEPFFSTKPTGEGTGLGLSLSHDIIVQGHGGRIEVESRPGEGTTFILLLMQNRLLSVA